MRPAAIAATVIIALSGPPGADAQSTESLPEAGQSPDPGHLLARTDSGQPVSPATLGAALSESSVIARLAPGQALRFLGVSVESGAESMVLLGASADVVYAACLEGSIRSGKAQAKPGQLIGWRPGGGAPESLDFDVKRLFASLSVELEPAMQAALDALIARQDRLKFWGALQPTRLNLQALRTPIAEATRRSYLCRPAVMALRLRHRGVIDLARGVAARFVNALRDGDADTAAALLDPNLFTAKDESIASGDWQPLRRAFGARLAGQAWRARLAGDAEIEATGNAAVWYVSGTPSGFSVTLGMFDGMPFVRSVEPAEAPVKKGKSP